MGKFTRGRRKGRLDIGERGVIIDERALSAFGRLFYSLVDYFLKQWA